MDGERAGVAGKQTLGEGFNDSNPSIVLFLRYWLAMEDDLFPPLLKRWPLTKNKPKSVGGSWVGLVSLLLG